MIRFFLSYRPVTLAGTSENNQFAESYVQLKSLIETSSTDRSQRNLLVIILITTITEIMNFVTVGLVVLIKIT